MMREKLEIAADRAGYELIYKKRDTKKCIGIVHSKKVVASPFYLSRVMPAQRNFFLLTTFPKIAVLYQRYKDCPTWIFDKVDDLKHISPPKFAGEGQALMILHPKNYKSAERFARQHSHPDREILVITGQERQLVRANFPECYEEMY